MVDDVAINKVAIIERCLRRIQEEYQGDFLNLENYTKQDSIILQCLTPLFIKFINSFY